MMLRRSFRRDIEAQADTSCTYGAILTLQSFLARRCRFLVAEDLKAATEKLKKDLRVATKRDDDVKAKYDVAAAFLDVSCEKVNVFLVGLCLLCDCDPVGQKTTLDVMNEAGKGDDFNGLSDEVSGPAAITENLLLHAALDDPDEAVLLAPLKQLIDRGGRRTEWASLHLVACMCRDGKKWVGGRKTNKEVRVCEERRFRTLRSLLLTPRCRFLVACRFRTPSISLGCWPPSWRSSLRS